MSESEVCGGYSPGQGSPLPGETASPKSCFQQSPSLPDSGLTELNVESPKIYHPPPCKPPGMPAPADSELSSDPPQKRYMGVRVKMPVRELLRKIRLSKGLEPPPGKVRIPRGWGAEKRRAHPYTEKQPRQSKQSAGQTPKGLEDLDILVEVLQEDLNSSQPREEPRHPAPGGCFWQGFPAELQRWEGAGSGDPQGRRQSPARLHQEPSWTDFHPTPPGQAELSLHGEQGSVQRSGSPGMFSRTGEKGSSWWMQDGGFSRSSPPQDVSALPSPAQMLLEAPRGSPDVTPISFSRQDLSALSFFQFQLHREENWLRNIPEEKLLAPDENGNRLLHKAVAQGRRALTFALAQRFASLNKIDEKDAEKRTALHLAAEKNQHLMVSDLISLGANVNEQDSSGKTPLHLCAENGYLRVLEVLKNCKNNGVCVEVDLPDHHGLTPLLCAAVAHTVLVTQSQSSARDTSTGRFLTLRKDQILEGILCLLQMGAKPQLQVLNSCQTSTSCPKLEENTELMWLLQTHKPQAQDVLQEPCLVSTQGRHNSKMMRSARVGFTAKEENRTCQFAQQVCADPRDFQGYDKVLGLCICHSGSLEEICNSQCRREQKHTLQLSCAERKAQLLITHSNGSKTAVLLEGLRKVLPRPSFSLEGVCAAGQRTQAAHLVETSGKGFLGVYNPDPQLIHDLIMMNEDPSLYKISPPPAAAPAPSGPEECRDLREQTLSPPNSTSQPKFLGILNPTTCTSDNVSLVFIMSREHFPLYDVNNLYNTNAEFDWGDFRSLREEIRENSRNSQKFLLFLFHFQAPGTYVLHLSSNKHKRMYVRVMPAGGRCPQDGPFLPSSPRVAVQLGMGRRKELLLSPDWAALTGLISGLLLLLAAALFLWQGLGWAGRGSPSPAFRRRQLQYSLDRFSRFSSQIPELFVVTKPHPGLQRGDDAWEDEGQIDLESFNTKVFFELLLRQSQSVTTTLGHFQEEVKALYHRIMNEISSLKNLWIKILSTPGKGEDEDDNESRGTEQQVEASVCSVPFQVPFPGSPLENPQATRFYGLSEISNNPWELIPQKLIPLLHSVLRVLEENRKNNLSPESPEVAESREQQQAAREGGELRAVDPAALSPREFVVFQYGLSILKFLTFHMKAPGVALGVASSLPPSPAPGNAFRNYFFYQVCPPHTHKILLFPSRALKACLSEMLSLRLQLSAAAQGDKAQGINQMLLKGEPISTEEINLISQLFEVRVKSLADMEALEKSLLLRVKSEESLNKWLVKKTENFLHPLSSRGRKSLGQRAHLEEESVNSSSPSELEDKVDALTEELVQILEDEQQFLSSEGNEDLLSYYLEITTLEKESLVKQINELEEEIARGREL
ncbi:hypothetical protein HGM15179_016757 [Zosterops borbonicus]|uniref:OCA domain-containing protein n=1 Tax=Zosterops borbonicus TaxID=364589 RepID=A0A8K1G294_9PASS|nr:hypothetical protein HGM15179_016757 [Zosterops borbonicus]